jgi:hypothetical protein
MGHLDPRMYKLLEVHKKHLEWIAKLESNVYKEELHHLATRPIAEALKETPVKP